jgi:hypothetical protein
MLALPVARLGLQGAPSNLALLLRVWLLQAPRGGGCRGGAVPGA